MEEFPFPTLIGTGQENDWRTLIRLELQVGKTQLSDQFEWPLLPQDYLPSEPINHPGVQKSIVLPTPTPESFAVQYCADLGIAGEYIPIIAHAIREQLFAARMNFEDAPKSKDVPAPPFRAEDEDILWNPLLEELDPEELEQRMKENERAARFL